MKKIICISMLALMVILFSAVDFFPVRSEANVVEQQGLVSSIGRASITATPDVAWVTLGVTSSKETVEMAQQDVAKSMNTILEAIKKNAIKDEHIKTVQFNIFPNYVWDDVQKESKLKGYTVSHQVEVRIEDVDVSGKLLDQVVKAGGNSVSGIRFGLSDETALYAKALEAAVKDAKLKAEAMGSGLGITVMKPIRIVEQSGYSLPYRSADAMPLMAEKDTYQTTIMSGEIQIQAEVMVEFAY